MDKKTLTELGVAEEIADKVLAQVNQEVDALTTDKTAAETKASDLEKQLNDVSNKLKGFEGMDVDKIKQEVKNWQEKYDKDTADLQAKLDAQTYDHALDAYLGGYKFTSDLARRGVEKEMKAKGFKLEEGKFLGADDYMKSVMEANPAAFEQEQEDSAPTPQIMTGSGGTTNASSLDVARSVMGLSVQNSK
jgi:hypothetical protein|nr:MAG TPA: minor structural protein [Caudoviricetes sp.]